MDTAYGKIAEVFKNKKVEEMEKEYIPYMQDIFRALPQTFFLKDSEGKYAFASKVCELVNAGSDGTLIGKKTVTFSMIKCLESVMKKKTREF